MSFNKQWHKPNQIMNPSSYVLKNLHTLTIIKPSNTVHIISSIRGQANLPTQVFHNNFQVSNKQEKVKLLNNYFCFVFSTGNDTLVIVPPSYICKYLYIPT